MSPRAWSPDSRRLLVNIQTDATGDYGLAVKDLATGTLIDLVSPLAAREAVWSQDGAALYVHVDGASTLDGTLWRIDATTGKTTPYSFGEPAQGQFMWVWGVRPLHDDSVYAFLKTASPKGDETHSALVHMSSDGRVVQNLNVTTYAKGRALWAADNSGVLMEQIEGEPGHGLVTRLVWQPADGGAPTVIAQDISLGEMYWGHSAIHWGQ